MVQTSGAGSSLTFGGGAPASFSRTTAGGTANFVAGAAGGPTPAGITFYNGITFGTGITANLAIKLTVGTGGSPPSAVWTQTVRVPRATM